MTNRAGNSVPTTVPNENFVLSHDGCHPPMEAQRSSNFSDLIGDPKSAE